MSKRKTVSDGTNSLLIEEISNICPLCGRFERTGEEMTKHHINHDPGISEYWNLIRICNKCHIDLTKNKNDGVLERRVKLVKKDLFRKYFGPAAVSAMKVARERGMVDAMPYVANELCEGNLIILKQRNVQYVGEPINVEHIHRYELTDLGRKVLNKLFPRSI